MKNTKPIIVIPSRLSATRLPNKPLLLINGLPMIVQVVKRALEADLGKVVVASADIEINNTIQEYFKNEVEAIITDATLPSGSDRINQALSKIKDDSYTHIINLQGDLPTVESKCIVKCMEILQTNKYDISTIGAIINNEQDKENSNVVKAVVSFNEDDNIGKALYFTRSKAPWGEGDLYHHIGIYGYKIEALKKFTSLKVSSLEKREKLEQLRALENNMSIGFAIVDTIPIGVDTKEDLIKADNYFKIKT